MQHRFIVLAVAAVLATTRIAAACDDSGSTTPMISPGIVIGTASTEQGHGDFIFGAELSRFRLSESAACAGDGAPSPSMGWSTTTWVGGYVDGVYDFANHAARVTLGPEVGTEVVGIDGGLAVEATADQVHVGFALRPVLTFGYVQLFFRWEELTAVGSQYEAGTLLKWPVELPRRGRQRRG